MSTLLHLSTATPAQIDKEIARVQQELSKAYAAAETATATIERIDAAEEHERDYPWNSPVKRAEAVESQRAAQSRIVTMKGLLAPLVEEFTRRGGWARYYLVTNAGGHVHWTTSCSTCFPSTQFAWLTDYSGMSHADFVEEAGATACTMCFPDAPVEVYSRATRIKYESAEVRARREEREAKAAVKAASEVRVEGYIGYRGVASTKTFKSVRAVTNDIASHLNSLCWYGETHPSAAEWVANIQAARGALAARGENYDYDKALASARKRAVREGGQPKF